MNTTQHIGSSSLQTGILDSADVIPPLPLIVAYVLELTSNDDVSTVSLAHALEADSGLTAKILRISNSAYYSPSERIYTVRDAIRYIGFESVRSLAITTTMVNRVWVDDKTFSRQMFWRHSLRCGLFAREIALALRSFPEDVLFTIGVLHDVGRVALIQNDPVQYERAIEQMKLSMKYLWIAESEVFGINHAELGGQLAIKWKMPESYVSAIMWHHEPEKAGEHRTIAHIIELADALAHSTSPRDRSGLVTPPLVERLWTPLGLSEKAVRALYDRREAIEQHTRSIFETATIG